MQIVIQIRAHMMAHVTNEQLGAFVAHCYKLENIAWVKVTKADDSMQGTSPTAEIAFNLPSSATLVDSEKLEAQLRDSITFFGNMEPFPCPCGCGAFISVSPCLRQSGTLVEQGISQEEKDATMRGNIVEAVKLHRARTGKGLKDSKATIDDWLARIPEPAWENFKNAYMARGGYSQVYSPHLASSDPYNRIRP